MAINRPPLATPPARDNELELPAARSETEATVNRAFAPLAQAIKDLQQEVRSLRQEVHNLRVEVSDRQAQQEHRTSTLFIGVIAIVIAAVGIGTGVTIAVLA